MTQVITQITLKDGSELNKGEYFRTANEPGQIFKFLGLIVTAAGTEHISAFGGDKNPEAHQMFRAFYPDIPMKKVKKF